MTLEDIKALVEEGNRQFAEFRKSNDERLRQIETHGKADALLVEKVEKLSATLTATEDRLAKRADGLERRIQTEGIFSEPKSREDELKVVKAFSAECGQVLSLEQYRAYQKAQGVYLRKGEQGMTGEERAALSVGSDSDGGNFVTPDVTGKVVTKLFQTSAVRQVADIATITTDSLEGKIDRSDADSGWVGETESRPETNTPQVEKWSIPVHEQYAKPKATQKVLDDAGIDIEGWLARKIADKFSRRENTAFVTGDGVGKPRGFASYPTLATADDSRAWGTMEHVLSGVSGALGADAFHDFLARFRDQYTANFRFGFHRLTLAAIRKLKDGQNNYLWEPRFDVGQPPTILGEQYVKFEDMPTVAANALAVVGGDFAQGYQIVDRLGIRTLRDPYSSKPFVEFYTTKRVGGAVIDFDALKFIKITP